MTIRRLEAEEYSKLGAVAEGFIPDPANSVAVVAENESGEIRGRMLVVAIPVVEGTWVHPDDRGGTIGYRLEKKVVEEVRGLDLRAVFAYTTNEIDGGYMERLGWKRQPLTVWSKEL